MAAERVLSLPLTGLEIRKALLHIIGKTLEADCYLNADTAYDRFSCVVSLSIRCHDIGRVVPVEVTEVISGKAPDADENSALDAADKQFEIESESPNQTRIETGQDVPVLTRDVNGKEQIKGIRYSKKDLAKAK